MMGAMRALWSRDEEEEVDEIPETIPVLEVTPENLDPKQHQRIHSNQPGRGEKAGERGVELF